MYTVTESFHEACKSPGRSITSKITFNGVSELAASEIQEIVVTEQCGSSDGVTIGASFSSQCKVTIYKQTPALPLNGAYFAPSVGVILPGDAGTVYVPKGVFYVPSDGVENSGNLCLTITGYDRMAALTDEYTPTISFPATPNAMLTDICLQANITAPEVAFPDMVISNPYAGTIRQQLGWLAGLIGANAKFDATGQLVFRKYSEGITVGLDAQYQNGLKKTADDRFAIQALVTGTEDNPITVGTGTSISATNPYMTEANR